MFNVIKTLPKKPPMIVIKKTKSGAKKRYKAIFSSILEKIQSKYE